MATTRKKTKKKATRKKAVTRKTSASKSSSAKASSTKKTTKRTPKSQTSSPAVQGPSHLSFGFTGDRLPPGTLLPLDPNRGDIKVAARKERFILSLAEHGNISLAAHCAGWKSRNAAYYHQKEDPTFATLWSEAEEIATDALEHRARERAIGWDEPIVNKDGEVVGQRRCYSDKMMEMLLKAKRRREFGDKVDHEVTHGGGVIVIPAPLNADEFEKIVFEQQQRHRESNTNIVSEQ